MFAYKLMKTFTPIVKRGLYSRNQSLFTDVMAAPEKQVAKCDHMGKIGLNQSVTLCQTVR